MIHGHAHFNAFKFQIHLSLSGDVLMLRPEKGSNTLHNSMECQISLIQLLDGSYDKADQDYKILLNLKTN